MKKFNELIAKESKVKWMVNGEVLVGLCSFSMIMKI